MNSHGHSLRRLTLALVGAGAVGLCGCASLTEKTTRWLSSDVVAYGVLDARVMRGQASFPSEREATLQLQSSDAPGLSCFGSLRFTASNSGVVDFSCSDGRSLMVPFQSLGVLSGAGRGSSGPTRMAISYGLAPEKAASFLGLPADRLLMP